MIKIDKRKLISLAMIFIIVFNINGCSNKNFTRNTSVTSRNRGLTKIAVSETTVSTTNTDNDEEYVQYTLDERPQGSAQFLEGDVMLIDVEVTAENKSLSNADRDYVLNAETIACDYLEHKATENDKNLNLIHAESYDSDLWLNWDYDGALNDFRLDGSGYTNALQSFIDNDVELESLMEEYETSSYAFLIHVPISDCCYTCPDDWGYNEYCILPITADDLNAHDPPSVYAHEILHLFGALDMYDVADYYGVTQEVLDYDYEQCPDDIMRVCYNDNGSCNYDAITQDLSEITLYAIGWDDGENILKYFPSIARENTAAF